MQTITSSVIVCKALGLEPDGVPAKSEGDCAYCGLHIAVGDPMVPFQAGAAFMDDHSLAAKGSGMVCGHCAQVLSADSLRQTGYGMFHAGGVMLFRKWGDIAAAILNPPDTPFVAVYATANNQHMAWRAPVNFSRDLIYVRVGLRDLKIRRPILDKIIESARFLGDAMVEADKIKVDGNKTLPNPFITFSRDLKDPATGVYRNLLFHQDFWKDEFEPHVRLLNSMTLGELWALRFILTPGAGQDTQPV